MKPKDTELESLVCTVDISERKPGQSLLSFLSAKLAAKRASQAAKEAKHELALITNNRTSDSVRHSMDMIRQAPQPPSPKPGKPGNVLPFAKPAPTNYANDCDDTLVRIVRNGWASPAELAEARAELSRRGITIHKQGFSKSHKK